MTGVGASTVPVRGLEHIGLFSQNTEALALWYRDTFGAVEVSRSDGTPPIVFLSFGGGALIELIPVDTDSQSNTVSQTDHVHLCFSVRDIAERVEELREAGVPIDRDVFKAYDGSPVAFIRDPESNLLQLVERVDGSSVHAAVYGDGG